ncbi:hypothetical protein F5Y18DRAFT_248461 [Xylariaceae sp. FL1019]|nr:hypothetical protein F5Y18DRAFT_248461 [Xylariaceae sp. FL1019]
MSMLNRPSSPRFVLPSQSSRHRTACLALYRALLRIAPQISLPDDLANGWAGKDPIAIHIARAFKRNVKDSSPRLIYPALQAGYRMLAVLKDAAESDSSPQHAQIREFLQARLVERHRSHAAAAKRAALPPRPDKSTAPKPGTIPLLVNVTPEPTDENPKPKIVYDTPNRPLRKGQLGGTGKRKVPHMDTMGEFPFMRFTKPQPRIIHRVLFDKNKKRFKRMSMRQEFTEGTRDDMVLEDEWEKSVADLMRREQGLSALEAYDWSKPNSKVKWKLLSRGKQIEEENEWMNEHDAGPGTGQDDRSYAWTLYEHGVQYLSEKLWIEREKNIAIADAMRKLIIEEKRLAAEEHKEDKRNKYIAGKKLWQEKMKAKHGDEWYIVANQNRRRRKVEEEKNQKKIRRQNTMKRLKLLAWMKEKQRAKIRREYWAKVKAERVKVWEARQIAKRLRKSGRMVEETLELKPQEPTPAAERPVADLSSAKQSREKLLQEHRQKRHDTTSDKSIAAGIQEKPSKPIIDEESVRRKLTKEERTAAYQQRLKNDAERKEQRLQEQEAQRRHAESTVLEHKNTGKPITDPSLLKAKRRLETAEQFEKGQLANSEQAKQLAKEARIKKHADLLLQHQEAKAKKPRYLTKEEKAQRHAAMVLEHAKTKAQQRLENEKIRLEKERERLVQLMISKSHTAKRGRSAERKERSKQVRVLKHVDMGERKPRADVMSVLEGKGAQLDGARVSREVARAPKMERVIEHRAREASRLSPEDKKVKDEERRKAWEEKMRMMHGEGWRELMVKSRGKVARGT